MSKFELPYSAEEIPVEKIFEIDQTEFLYKIIYNKQNDFYTMQVLNDLKEIIYTSKLVLKNDILHAGKGILNIFSTIEPTNRAENNDTALNVSNFNTGIFLLQIEP